MDQLRSVGFTAVQTLAPILDELAGANDVAQQGSVAHVGLVVQVEVPILIDSGHLWPIFWVVLGAAHLFPEATLPRVTFFCEIGALRFKTRIY